MAAPGLSRLIDAIAGLISQVAEKRDDLLLRSAAAEPGRERAAEVERPSATTKSAGLIAAVPTRSATVACTGALRRRGLRSAGARPDPGADRRLAPREAARPRAATPRPRSRRCR